jgi:uncharacterized protein YecE (DUF72 family)
MKFYIGCSGWSYSVWKGPFYPSNIDSSKWLKYYSNVFDYVEIDSSFYRIPNVFAVKNWFKKTPDNFRFTAKFPKVITHDKHLVDVEKEVEVFLRAIEPLHEKTLALLIQLPPSMEIMQGLEGLRQLIPFLDNRFRYAVEVRHQSWFQDLAYNFFSNNNICMVWSQLAGIRTPPIVTSDFLYIRFIGDRSIEEKDFGVIQKDRITEMSKWARRIKRVETEEQHQKLNLAIVAANNHYAGFGPGTANIFRKMVGMPEAIWTEEEDKILPQQQQKQIDDDNNIEPSVSLGRREKKHQSKLTDFLE